VGDEFLKEYKPSKIDTKVLLFRAIENECKDYSLGWDKLVDEIDIVGVSVIIIEC